MANIMITDVCNLKCPYCFANEFVNKDANEISLENFERALEFITKGKNNCRVGIIGGEPTLHSRFKELLRNAISNSAVDIIVVYTNGVRIEPFLNELSHPKVRMLINCNSPKDIGTSMFQRIEENINLLVNERMMQDRISIGINIYSTDLQYDYLIDILKKYNFKNVRVSITVPNIPKDRNTDAHRYFLSRKEYILKFFEALLEEKIVPYFDCNKIPSCLVSKKDLSRFRKYLDDPMLRTCILNSNISHNKVRCNPVIDITQDLKAVRCFGLSEYTKQDISNFDCIDDLRAFYIKNIDAYAYNTAYSHICTDCKLRESLKCNGGCLSFKINDIMKMKSYSDKLLAQL